MAQPLIAAGLAVGLLPALSLARRHPGVEIRAWRKPRWRARSASSGWRSAELPPLRR